MIAQTYGELAPLVADGTLSAPIEATYRIEEYRKALERAAMPTRTAKVLFSMA
jgi:hypothetical protein